MKPRRLLWLVLLLVGLWFALDLVADQAAARLNKTLDKGTYRISPATKGVHERLIVADLHADTLLWPRDPLARSSWGHVDLPRLLEGGVAIQGFGVVTKTPAKMNFERNTGDTDRILTLAMASKWPPRTYGSLLERARYQAGRLADAAERSAGKLIVLRTRADLEALLARRARGEKVVGGYLSLEGTHVLEGKIDNLDLLFADGFRQLAQGGIAGIALFEGATCGSDVEATLRAIDHARKAAGVDAVAIGSDFDGAITAPIDADGLPLLTQGLLARGYSEEEIAKILGGNAVRFLRATLPPG